MSNLYYFSHIDRITKAEVPLSKRYNIWESTNAIFVLPSSSPSYQSMVFVMCEDRCHACLITYLKVWPHWGHVFGICLKKIPRRLIRSSQNIACLQHKYEHYFWHFGQDGARDQIINMFLIYFLVIHREQRTFVQLRFCSCNIIKNRKHGGHSVLWFIIEMFPCRHM